MQSNQDTQPEGNQSNPPASDKTMTTSFNFGTLPGLGDKMAMSKFKMMLNDPNPGSFPAEPEPAAVASNKMFGDLNLPPLNAGMSRVSSSAATPGFALPPDLGSNEPGDVDRPKPAIGVSAFTDPVA